MMLGARTSTFCAQAGCKHTPTAMINAKRCTAVHQSMYIAALYGCLDHRCSQNHKLTCMLRFMQGVTRPKNSCQRFSAKIEQRKLLLTQHQYEPCRLEGLILLISQSHGHLVGAPYFLQSKAYRCVSTSLYQSMLA